MLKISELKGVIDHIITNNRFLEMNGKKKNTLGIESVAGIGKTSVVEQSAKENGLNFVKISLSQIEEVGDLVGFPIREFEVMEGKSPVWVNEKHLEWMEAPKLTGNTRTSYCPPKWIPSSDKGGVLLLDDWSRADIRIIQACMELVDRQQYISWSLPPDWHIILTANPDNGDYFVTSMDDAQKTRFINVNLQFDTQEWATWAELEGIDSRCINFLLLNPEMINTGRSECKIKVNARIATDFFNSISSLKDFSDVKTLQLIQLLGEGSVGPEFAACFALFINNKLDKVPSPKDIMDTDTDVGAINKIKAAVGAVDTATYKQNIASVISTRLINYMSKIIEDKSFHKKETVSRIAEIVKGGVFSGDINYNFIKTLNMKKQFAPLIEDKEIVKIVTR